MLELTICDLEIVERVDYLATWLPGYVATCLRGYLTTQLPNFVTTTLPGYLQCFSLKETKNHS
jgi:hypothetical protein